MTVVIRQRVRGAGGTEVREESVLWPRGWPLPQQGSIVLGREISGWCEYTEHDLVNQRIIVVLRAP